MHDEYIKFIVNTTGPSAAIENIGIITDSPSSSDMIVTVIPYRYQTSSIIQNFTVSLAQYNRQNNGSEEHVVFNNQTQLQTRFTSLSKCNSHDRLFFIAY